MATPALISDTVLRGEMEWMQDSLQIDSLKNIRDTKVYLYSGTKDTVVHQGVVKKLEAQLETWVDPDKIHTEYSIPSVHSWVTDYTGHECGTFETPFIVNCGYDQAGILLSHIFGPMANRSSPTVPPSKSIMDNIYEFSQAPYVPGIYTLAELSLYPTAYAYVPQQCLRTSSHSDECKFLVLLHGCEQSIRDIGMDMVFNTGVLQYAETNSIVVLMPQADKSVLNPKGCFDWWGYTGVEYPTKLGPQVSTIHNMMSQVMK